MDFKNIPNKYRPIPFWSWNEKLNTEETKSQIEQMHRVGIGGFFMHARGGLQTDYMGEEWFNNITAGVETGQKLGMRVWAYDENGWPSGFGNGVINGKGVKYQQKYLRCEKGEKQTETTIANVGGYHFYYEVNPFYVDLLNKEVTQAFLDEVYEVYYQKYGDKIEGFFTDEPQLSRAGIPWSTVLEKEYQEEYREDLLSKLPELFFDKGDYQSTRVKFWRLITKLFSHNYAKQIYDWCEKRGLKFTGHMVMEETLEFQLTTNGAVMPNYRYFHIPGMDCLGRQKIAKKVMYQVASVAEQFGKEQVLSETFALMGWNVSFEELKQIYEWQMVRGINLLCTHLAAYSLRGIRKRDYPACFSYQEPWWDKYNLFVDSMSRIGMLLSNGKTDCKTVLIHPQTTAWMLFDGNENNEQIKEYDEKFDNVIDELEKKHILFHLGDEIIMEEEARVEGNKLIIGKQEYTTVILPPHLILMDTTKKLLETFKNNGGTVVEGTQGLACVNVVDDERIVYTKRQFADFDLYYFVNTSDEKISAKIEKGTCILNIVTGEKEPFNSDVVFEPSGSLVVLVYQDSAENSLAKDVDDEQIDLSGEWNIETCDYNAITLDKCQYSFDGELIEAEGTVTSIQDKACALRRKVRVDMKYTVKADYVPNDVFLVCEMPEIFEIFVNGRRLQNVMSGYYRDKSFKKLDLRGYLQIGDNEILVSCDFEQSKTTYENIEKAKIFESELNKLTYDMEIENMYILGDFSVRTDGAFTALDRDAVRYSGNFVISEPKRKITLHNIEQQGFPFFNGKMTVSKTFDLHKGQYTLSLDRKLASMVCVKVNGEQVGDILWKPYAVDLTPFVREGKNVIEITLVSSLRNLLGPHHLQEGEVYDVCPGCFFKEEMTWKSWFKKTWDEAYTFVVFGL